MKNILFRADAAPHIGIGDLMSLINISKYFNTNEFKTYFIIRNYKASVDLIEKYEVNNCLTIDKTASLEEEVDLINSFISINNIDMIFFEITERKLSDYTNIDKNVKKVAVNFDEYILDDLDLFIDWDVAAFDIFDRSKYPNTKFLLGPEFVILPQEFYSQKVKSRVNNLDNKKVLIAMGGADELDFTYKVVTILINSELDIELNIIIGSGYEKKDTLEQQLVNSNMKYEIKQNVSDMLSEYLSCDIGIGAGGLTSSEMVAAKISPILIATYEHQIARCSYFDEMGWAKFLGYRTCDEQVLIDAINNPTKPLEENIFKTKVIIDEIKKI